MNRRAFLAATVGFVATMGACVRRHAAAAPPQPLQPWQPHPADRLAVQQLINDVNARKLELYRRDVMAYQRDILQRGGRLRV